MEGLSPPLEPYYWRRRSNLSRGASSQGSVYSDDKAPRSRLSLLIRKDSFDLQQRPRRPPRPRDTVDMAVFANDRRPSDQTTMTSALRELEQALGPLDHPVAPAFVGRPKRVPVPHIDTSLHEQVVPPDGDRQTSAISQVSTCSFSGRKAKRRDDIKRLASIMGQAVLDGVDVERIVHMERKAPKSADRSPTDARDSMVPRTIGSPVISPMHKVSAPAASSASLRGRASVKTAPSIKSSASQGPRKLQRTRSMPSKSPTRTKSSTRLLAKLMPNRIASAPEPMPAAKRQGSDESLSYSSKADAAIELQPESMPGIATTADIRVSPTHSIFGEPLGLLPDDSMCLALVGGEIHKLPIVVFAAVEQLFKRGLSASGLFRLPGDQLRIDGLVRIFDAAPLFGDHQDLENESVHNVAGLFKRYLRDMPTPVFDDRLTQLFANACVESAAPIGLRVIAARIIIRLLPKRQLSLFIYLMAFLAQIPFGSCHLDHNALGIVLGPAIMAPRSDSIVGLGSPTNRAAPAGLAALDTEGAKDIRKAQTALTWLLENWTEIGTDFVSSTISAPQQTEDTVLYNPLGMQGLGVSVQDATPVMSHEGAVITPANIIDSPVDPLSRPARPRQQTMGTETSISAGPSPAPSFGSRSRRSSSTSASTRRDKDAKMMERSSSATFGPAVMASGADQTRKIVALEAELAQARRSSSSMMDLREQMQRREGEQDARLVETRQELDNARKEIRRLNHMLEKEHADKARRIEELVKLLDKSNSEKVEAEARLANVRSLLGFA